MLHEVGAIYKCKCRVMYIYHTWKLCMGIPDSNPTFVQFRFCPIYQIRRGLSSQVEFISGTVGVKTSANDQRPV